MAIADLKPFLKRPKEKNAAHPGQAVSLSARQLTIHRGEGKPPVIFEADLDIPQGQHVLLTGPSGAGKTTLAEALCGLISPSGGTISGQATLAPQHQDDHVFLDTFAFNLLLGRKWPPGPDEFAKATDLCEQLGLSGLLERMPIGLGQVVGETGWQLSNGERALLTVARAMLHNPQILIVDESLGPLDPEAALRTLQLLRKQVPTLIVVSHR